MAIDSSSLEGQTLVLRAWASGLVLAIAVVVGLDWFAIKASGRGSPRAGPRDLDELAEEDPGRARGASSSCRSSARRCAGSSSSSRSCCASSRRARNTEEMIKKIQALVEQGDFTLERLIFPSLTQGRHEIRRRLRRVADHASALHGALSQPGASSSTGSATSRASSTSSSSRSPRFRSQLERTIIARISSRRRSSTRSRTEAEAKPATPARRRKRRVAERREG